MSPETLIHTTQGLVPATELEVRDIITNEPNARVTATEWRRNGELVRRDVHVNILRGLSMGAEQGSM